MKIETNLFITYSLLPFFIAFFHSYFDDLSLLFFLLFIASFPVINQDVRSLLQNGVRIITSDILCGTIGAKGSIYGTPKERIDISLIQKITTPQNKPVNPAKPPRNKNIILGNVIAEYISIDGTAKEAIAVVDTTITMGVPTSPDSTAD
jgi:hypothetical protein